MVKPDPEIFEQVVDDLGVPPHRIAFFDDTPVNVKAASDAGLVAFEIDGLPSLVARLQKLGILDPSFRQQFTK
jgi:putative hydrolase of the HAD superfamily